MSEMDSSSRSLKYRSCFNSDESILDRSVKEQDSTLFICEDSSCTISMGSSNCTILSCESNMLSTEDKSTEKNPEEENKLVNPNDYVGFANLPNQVCWRAIKKGFEYTIMIVGESGLGKSTLINSLFLADIYDSTYPKHQCRKTVSIETTKVILKEGLVTLALTVVDTPGFGDALNNTDCWISIIDFIESKYENYFQSETKLDRKVFEDNRVHCCLFCIQASVHGLKQLDIEFMKRLCDKVNIVPVITKADTLTSEERKKLKKKILQEITENEIKIYEFPEHSIEDELSSLRKKVPFAVVASNTVIEVNDKKIRGREYPWGIVDIENMNHCDFMALRKMLICTHMQNLKDVTHTVHYENYRYCKLSGAVLEKEINEAQERLDKIKVELEEELSLKSHSDMERLKKCEADLTREYEDSRQSVQHLESEMKELLKLYEVTREQMEEARRQIKTK